MLAHFDRSSFAILISSHLNLGAAEFLVRQVANLSEKFEIRAEEFPALPGGGPKVGGSGGGHGGFGEQGSSSIEEAHGSVSDTICDLQPFDFSNVPCFRRNVSHRKPDGLQTRTNDVMLYHSRRLPYESSWLRPRILPREIRGERRSWDLRVPDTGSVALFARSYRHGYRVIDVDGLGAKNKWTTNAENLVGL